MSECAWLGERLASVYHATTLGGTSVFDLASISEWVASTRRASAFERASMSDRVASVSLTSAFIEASMSDRLAHLDEQARASWRVAWA